MSSSPSSTSRSPISSLLALTRSLSSKTLSTTDTTLLRLQTLLSTPTGIDTTLLTIGYTLTLLSSLLTRRLESHLTTLASTLATRAAASNALAPGEKLVASFPADPTTQRLVKLSASAKAGAGAVSDFRMFVRLWGLLGIYRSARGLWNLPSGGTETMIRKTIGWTQVLSIAGYQVLENAVYLAKKGVLNSEGWVGERGAQRCSRLFLIAGRLWLVYTAGEFARLGYEWYLWKEEADSTTAEEKEQKVARDEKRRAAELWRRKMVVNAAYAPMTVHYSVEGGCLSEGTIGALGTVVGVAGLRALWKETA